MRTVTFPAKPGALCHSTNRPDAVCRKLPRCRQCGRALSFNERITCRRCMAAKGAGQ
jgi:hypothetical protein